MRTDKEKIDIIDWLNKLKLGKDCPFAITVLETKEYGMDIHLVVGKWTCPTPVTIKQVYDLANVIGYLIHS